jgi:hypothetical protein
MESALPRSRGLFQTDNASVPFFDFAGWGRRRLLLVIPDRSKQQIRRLPDAIIEQALAMRRSRVSDFFAELTQ